MKLREYLRKEFSMYIRSRLVKDECEWCGETKNLHFHHVDRFHNLFNETLEELNLNELDTNKYSDHELNLISSMMLAKQIKSEYKTLCKKCHQKLHIIENKKGIYKSNYQNPFGDYFNVDLKVLKDIDGNYLFRFLKMCCYMNYDGRVRFGNQKGKGSLARKKDLSEMFQISSRECEYTVKCFLTNNLISINEKGNIEINSKIAFKGSSDKADTVRVFSNSMISLYNNTTICAQSTVFLIFKLSNFLNTKYNIITESIFERDIDDIKNYTVKGICKFSQLDDSNIQRIFRILRATNIDECNYLLYKIKINSKNYYIVNPCLIYGGMLNNDILDCYNLINSDNVNEIDK